MNLLKKTIIAAALLASSNPVLHAQSIYLTGTVRDFLYNGTSSGSYNGHVDFQNVIANDPGIVTSTIGADRKPVYAHGASSTVTVHGETGFNQWYNDTPNVNQSLNYGIILNETAPGSGTYAYQNPSFFPIDNQLLGNQGDSHNYSFTYELHSSFTYNVGQTFDFTGDDDVWVYINDKLVIDLGGVHSAESASVNLDTLGLTAGNTYNFDFFFAERHTSESNLKISTSIPLVPTTNAPDAGSSFALLSFALAGLKFARRFTTN
jgi:fibro-slime domain-containing protein